MKKQEKTFMRKIGISDFSTKLNLRFIENEIRDVI